jgi:uncharacterized cupin superfamily protein
MKHCLGNIIGQIPPALSVGERSDNKKLPYPEASRVIITRNAQNGDLLLDYFQNDKRVAQEIIYGHTISRVSVEFP